MRFVQLTSKTSLFVGDAREREEAIREITGQKRTGAQVFGRLSLGVQQPLYSLDNFAATGEEELEKLDVSLERRFARTLRG